MKNFPGFRPFRNVIVCSMVPGVESESVVGGVFGHYDPITRPQDLGVVGRYILSYDDLYLHILERKADPAISGQRRGLPAFEKIAETIAPYVTPYPSYWTNPSHSVAQQFYTFEPAEADLSDSELTVLVQRMERGSEEAIAQVFADSDAGELPGQLGVVGRSLYSIDDVFVHVLEQDRQAAAQARSNHELRPAFGAVMKALSPYVRPYNPQTWSSHLDAKAQVFYQWEAPDWGSPPPVEEAASEQTWSGKESSVSWGDRTPGSGPPDGAWAQGGPGSARDRGTQDGGSPEGGEVPETQQHDEMRKQTTSAR